MKWSQGRIHNLNSQRTKAVLTPVVPKIKKELNFVIIEIYPAFTLPRSYFVTWAGIYTALDIRSQRDK